MRILPQKAESEEIAWKAIELIVLHGLEKVATDLGLGGHLFKLQSAAQAPAAECVAN
jgi:hypothetical protein